MTLQFKEYSALSKAIENNQVNLLLSREGMGKSLLAMDLVQRLRKVIFLCESNVRCLEKFHTFSSRGIRTQLIRSKSVKIKQNGFNVYTIPMAPAFQPRVLDKDEILAGMEAKLGKQEALEQYNSVVADEFDLSGKYDIIVATFAQIRQIQGFSNDQWIVMFDDPDRSTVNKVEQLSGNYDIVPKDFNLKKIEILPGYDSLFIFRPERLNINYQVELPQIFTTTENITGQMIQTNLRASLIDLREHQAESNIHLISTNVTRKQHDRLIPYFVELMNYKGADIKLFQNGVDKFIAKTHEEVKGSNEYIDCDTVVEVSWPRVDEHFPLIVEFPHLTRDTLEFLILLDQLHQSIGRNQGHRYNGRSCYVLCDRQYAKRIHNNLQYEHKFYENETERYAAIARGDNTTDFFIDLYKFLKDPEQVLVTKLPKSRYYLIPHVMKKLGASSDQIKSFLKFMAKLHKSAKGSRQAEIKLVADQVVSLLEEVDCTLKKR